MSQVDEAFDDSFEDEDEGKPSGKSSHRAEESASRPSQRDGGWLSPYKAEQGKNVRWSTFIGVGLLIAWGGKYLNERLGIYEGDEAWRMLITMGIPIVFTVVLGVLAWWGTFVHPKASDFMIATEGEMKKVSWSSKKEIIGSTKVVIVVTIILALFIFVVDLVFQTFFRWIGVLKL